MRGGRNGTRRCPDWSTLRRTTLYRLVDGKAQPVMVRVGASDGSSTEISGGGIAEGDQIITGERTPG